jgi:hypothetical protein
MPALRPSALVVFLLLATVATAASQDASRVTKLRMPKVGLYKCPDGTEKLKEVSQSDFRGSWPVTGKPTDSGLLPVKVDGADYCVRMYAVETDKVISTSSDCGAVVASNQPKSGATRGVGENCPQNKK